MKQIILLYGILLTGILLFSCAPKPVIEKSAVPETLTQERPAIAKETWEVEWNNLRQAARKEGILSIYMTAGGEVRDALSRSFQDKFGLRLEATSGKGAEISQKLLSERRSGIYLADLYMGGTSTMLNQLKPAGMFDPLEPVIFLPEVLDPKVWYEGGIRWKDKDKSGLAFLTYVIPSLAINTTLVSQEEVKSYRDLLNPKWKGNMVQNDPTVAGVGLTFFRIIGGNIMGYDYMRELARNEPVILRDQRLQIEWVAKGKYPIAIAPRQEELNYFKEAGAPIVYVLPVEGSWTASGSGNLALLNKAPHPKAARVAANWLLTREAQTIISKAVGVPSARLDVPTDGLDPATLLKPGIKYIDANLEEIELRTPEDMKLAREIFGPLMK